MINTIELDNKKMDWSIIQQHQKKRVAQTNLIDSTDRKRQLNSLRMLVLDHEAEWLSALQEDLGKSAEEAFASEIAVLLQEINLIERQLSKWQKPKNKHHMKVGFLSKTSIEHHPYGSILIISPWNYPLQLSLMPVIGALAAGNSCFIKPSEFAPATAKVLAKLVTDYFSPEVLTVVNGDASVATQLLALPWDFIFFTGSKKVGEIVHKAAAEKQVPVVLELGGKNPCIVDETNLTKAVVQRIMWGKFLNAGQSCIAPDTIYVHQSVYETFLKMAIDQLNLFYGSQPVEDKKMGRIGHEKQFNKMLDFLKQGQIRHGGQFDAAKQMIEPTLLTDIPAESPILFEEIFGPILPVIPYTELSTLVTTLKSTADPLVVYVFSKNKKTIQYLNSELRSGAFSLNQVILHAISANSPFGGIGMSGFGRYHGQASLKSFSYERMIYTNYLPFNIQKQYPPYQVNDLNRIRKWRRWLF